MQELIAKSQALIFLRTIRSSPQFWELKKAELNSIIRQLGKPTFFITFSPAEVDWFELIVILEKVLNNNDISLDEAQSMQKVKRIDLICRDPVTVARYFENRLRELMKYIIHENGPFSENRIKDYFWRVDFQYRGSPHIHMVTWHEGAPVYTSPDTNSENKNYNRMVKECIKFVDKYITCNRPENNELTEEKGNIDEIYNKNANLKYQEHIHKSNCKFYDKSDNVMCKYSFPKPIMNETIILEPLDESDQDYNEFYNLYIDIRNELIQIAKNCKQDPEYCIGLDELLEDLDISREEYLLAISTSIKGPTVFLKRSCNELNLNQYNEMIYIRHRANMDIQYVFDPYAAAAYLTSYMLKSNAVMSILLKRAIEDIEAGNTSIRKQLNRIASKFQNCSEVSAQECVYTLLSMPVCHSSRETVFVNTFRSDQRDKLLLPKKILERMKNKTSTAIFQRGLIDHYKNRPDRPYRHKINEEDTDEAKQFENMCLAEFAAYWEYISIEKKKKLTVENYTKRSDDEDDSDDDEFEDEFKKKDIELDRANEKEENFVALRDGPGYVRGPKEKARILRYKKYRPKTERTDFLRVRIMLFTHWRNEDEFDSKKQDEIKQLYEIKKQEIIRNSLLFESDDAERYEAALEEIERNKEDLIEEENKEEVKQKEEGFDILAERGELDENLEDEFGFQADLFDPEINIQGDIDKSDDIAVPKRLKDDEYQTLMTTLNRKQHIYLMNCLNLIKEGKSFYHFVSGGAGTGKSRLISALYQTTTRLFNPTIQRDDKNNPIYDESIKNVLLASFTGKAAFNIRGMTLHALFHLPNSHKLEPMQSKLLSTTQHIYRNVKLIIIDEISMVGASMFRKVNQRLQQIKNNTLLFGGLPLIVLGDLNQLPPVEDNFVFKLPRTFNYAKLVDNDIWSEFKHFELTEIMRQRDDLDFAIALNTLANDGLHGLEDKQVNMFNKRIVEDITTIPNTAIFLFFKNSDVAEFNRDHIRNSPGILIENPAYDHTKGPNTDTPASRIELNRLRNETDIRKLKGLPHNIMLKVGKKYMITVNQNVMDGLVNGAVGVLQRIIVRKKQVRTNTVVKRLWFDFQDPSIGSIERKKTDNQKYYYKDSRLADGPINRQWTPLLLQDLAVYGLKKKAANPKIITFRRQFPIVECEAMTIHKSQGQTYQQAAINISGGLSRALLYVAFSRVTTLNGLYLFGARSILTPQIEAMSSAKKLKYIEKETHKKDVYIEKLRLNQSENRMTNIYRFLEQRKKDKYLTIMFNNIRSTGFYKLRRIATDHGFLKSDLILLSECHVHFNKDTKDQAQQYTIENYQLKYISGSKKSNNSHGQICYTSDNIKDSVAFIQDNTTRSKYNLIENSYEANITSILEMSIFTLNKKNKQIYICNVYIHPNNSELNKPMKIFRIIHNLLKDYKCWKDKNNTRFPLIIIGDFNIDFSKYLDDIKRINDEFHLELLEFLRDEPTLHTLKQNKLIPSKLDWCFISDSLAVLFEDKIQIEVYESWSSDHRPLCLIMKFD